MPSSVTFERFGRLDILINNAGISTALLRGEDQPVGKLWETTPEEFAGSSTSTSLPPS